MICICLMLKATLQTELNIGLRFIRRSGNVALCLLDLYISLLTC